MQRLLPGRNTATLWLTSSVEDGYPPTHRHGPHRPRGKHNAANGWGHEKRPEAEPRTFDPNREVLWRRS